MDNKTEQDEIFYAHRVSYGETDAMGVLYYAEYAHIFERSRNVFCRVKNMLYTEIEERGIILPVSELHCRYKKPAHYDDLLQVKVEIVEWRGASFKFAYTIYAEDKKTVLANGYTVQACVNKEGAPVRIPTWLKECFE